MREPIIPQSDLPHGQMIAHYKDRLSLLVRIDAFENMTGAEKGQPVHGRAKNVRAPKSRKGANLLTNLRKRLQALDNS